VLYIPNNPILNQATPKKSRNGKFKIPPKIIQSYPCLENLSTHSETNVVTRRNRTGEKNSIPLDKTGMVQSMLQVALGFQLENKLLLLKGKPNHKKKCGHNVNERDF